RTPTSFRFPYTTLFRSRIVLKSKAYGEWFQEKYNFLTTEYFEGEENIEINVIMTKIIKYCLGNGVIQEKDFFEDDFSLIDKINQDRKSTRLNSSHVKIS